MVIQRKKIFSFLDQIILLWIQITTDVVFFLKFYQKIYNFSDIMDVVIQYRKQKIQQQEQLC
jgi:hypothetical protein